MTFFENPEDAGTVLLAGFGAVLQDATASAGIDEVVAAFGEADATVSISTFDPEAHVLVDFGTRTVVPNEDGRPGTAQLRFDAGFLHLLLLDHLDGGHIARANDDDLFFIDGPPPALMALAIFAKFVPSGWRRALEDAGRTDLLEIEPPPPAGTWTKAKVQPDDFLRRNIEWKKYIKPDRAKRAQA